MSKKDKKPTIWIKPAKADVPVRRGTYELPAKGAEVEDDVYWKRRRRLGDVVLCDPPKKKKDEDPNKDPNKGGNDK